MANDLWRTPPEVYENLNQEFSFHADMASSALNHLHQVFFTEEDDSLSFSWKEKLDRIYKVGSSTKYVWCNPPYSQPKPWVAKALEAQKDGLGVVMLLNADDSTEWYFNALKGVSEIRRITGYRQGGKFKNGRLAFLNDDGKPASGNNKAQFILIFNPWKIGERQTTFVTKLQLMTLKTSKAAA